MSGFSYPQPIFVSSTYNSGLFLSLRDDGSLTYAYAQTQYLSKNDFRLSCITGVTAGSAVEGVSLVPYNSLNINGLNQITCGTIDSVSYKLSGAAVDFTNLGFLTGVTAGTASLSKALVLDTSNNISGINSMSMTSLTVNGVAITGTLPFALTGASLTLTGTDSMIVLTNTSSNSKSTIYFNEDTTSS